MNESMWGVRVRVVARVEDSVVPRVGVLVGARIELPVQVRVGVRVGWRARGSL